MIAAEEKHKGHGGQHGAEDVIELVTFRAHGVVPREAECNQEKEKGCFENASFPLLTVDARQSASCNNDVCKRRGGQYSANPFGNKEKEAIYHVGNPCVVVVAMELDSV